jgi:hypothetical protein
MPSVNKIFSHTKLGTSATGWLALSYGMKGIKKMKKWGKEYGRKERRKR